MCARVPNLHSCGRPNCTPKVPNFGFGSLPYSHRETQWCKKNSRKRESQSVAAPSIVVTLSYTNALCGREKREKENAVSTMKKSSGSSFQNLQGTLNFVSSKSGGGGVVLLQRRENTIVLPGGDNLFPDWGFVFFFVFFFVCALFRSRLFVLARKQRK